MSNKEKHIQDQRPLSPHLTIYKPQITSVLSISHRLAGIALFLGTWLLAVWIILNAYGCGDCINALISSGLGKFFLFLWSAALYYHLLNGIRHLFWDVGLGFKIATVNKSGIAVILGTLALLLITWCPFVGLGVGN